MAEALGLSMTYLLGSGDQKQPLQSDVKPCSTLLSSEQLSWQRQEVSMSPLLPSAPLLLPVTAAFLQGCRATSCTLVPLPKHRPCCPHLHQRGTCVWKEEGGVEKAGLELITSQRLLCCYSDQLQGRYAQHRGG